MSLALTPRIKKELERVQKSPIEGISIASHKDNPRHLDVVILGPQDCCFSGGQFRLEMWLPEEYPVSCHF